MSWLSDLWGAVDPDDVAYGDEDQESQRDPSADVEEVGDLGDLDELAGHLFRIWSFSAELRWAAYAWDVLTRAGLTSYVDEVERTLVVCRLVVLAGISREFAARAFDEGLEGDWDEAVGIRFEGDYPLLDRLALGRLAERLGVQDDAEYAADRDNSTHLVIGVAKNQWDQVCSALIEQLDEDGLFASLRLSPKATTRYPLPDEIAWRALNTDVDGMSRPYQWICDGLPQ